MINDLSIKIHGNNEGFLTLPKNATLSLEELKAMFDEDLSLSSFSLPLTIPINEINAALLGHQQQVMNFQPDKPYWTCTVYWNGFPEIINGKLTILQVNSNVAGSLGNININITGAKGLFYAKLSNKNVKSIYAGGVINFDNRCDSRLFAYRVNAGQIQEYPYLRFPRVFIEGFKDTSRADYDDLKDFLVQDCVNNVIFDGSGTVAANGVPANSTNTVEITEGTAGYEHYATIPFFLLKYILTAGFKEIGYSLVGDFMTDSRFDNVCIFNNYAIDQYDYILHQDINRQIIPSNHLPDISLAKYIKNIIINFGLKLDVLPNNNAIQLSFRTNILNKNNAVDITEFIIDDIETTNNVEDKSGYEIKYNFEDGDGLVGDFLKERKEVNNQIFIGDKELVGTVNELADLATFIYPGQLTTNHCVKVNIAQLYYSPANANTNPVIWEPYSTLFQSYIVGDAGNTTDLPIAPLLPYIWFNKNTGLNQIEQGYSGCRLLGSYINSKNIRVKNKFGLRLLFAGVNGGFLNPPHLSPVVELNGLGFTMDLIPNYGILQFHQPWMKYKNALKEVKAKTIPSIAVVKLLDNYDMVIIKSIWYLVKKVEKQIPQVDHVVLTLVPL
jgi:hypothetical protein